MMNSAPWPISAGLQPAAPSAIGYAPERFLRDVAGSFSTPPKLLWLTSSVNKLVFHPHKISSLRALAQRQDLPSSLSLDRALHEALFCHAHFYSACTRSCRVMQSDTEI